jgi:hypothetical protein
MNYKNKTNFKLTIKYEAIKVAFILYAIFNFNGLIAQSKTPQHAWSFGLTNALNKGVKTDSLGNLYLVGQTGGNADFDPGTSTSTISAGVYIAKYTPNKELVWATSISAGTCNFFDVSAGGKVVLVGGYTSSTLFAGSGGAYMATINNNGTLLSSYSLPNDGNNGGSVANDMLSCVFDKNENVIIRGRFGVTGSILRSIDLDPATGFQTATTYSSASGTTDYLVRLTANLTYLNHRFIGGGQIGNSWDMKMRNDTLYWAVELNGATNFNQGNSTAFSETGPQCIVAYNATNFNVLWTCPLAVGTTNSNMRLAFNSNNELAVAYQSNWATNVDLDPHPLGTYSFISRRLSTGLYSLYLAHYNTTNGTLIAGNKQPRMVIDSIESYPNIYLNGFYIDKKGGYYFSGAANGTFDFDRNPTSTYIRAASTFDSYFAKYNADLNIEYAAIFQNTANSSDGFSGIVSTDSSAVYVAGTYVSTHNVDSTKLSPNLPLLNATATNTVLAKYVGEPCVINLNINSADNIESCKINVTAIATSLTMPLKYQWYRNGVLLTADTFANIINTTAGIYQCKVSNNCGEKWSKKITLTTLTSFTTNYSYPLDGNTLNELGTTQNGVATAITYGKDRYGVNNKAAVFNGTSSVIDITGSMISGNNNGVSVWFKRANLNRKAMSLIGFQIASPGSWNPVLYLDSTGRLSGYVYPGGGSPIYSSGIVMDTNWHHAAWTYSAALGKQIIYLDGVEVGSMTSAALQIGTSNIFKIGNGYLNTTLQNVNTTGNNQFFEGLIDDVKITSTLKAGNVIQLFNDIKIYGQTPASLNVGSNIIPIPICAGTSATTQVLVGNSGLNYQWFSEVTKGTFSPLANGANYSGVKTNALTINSMPSTDLYLRNSISDNFCNAIDYNIYLIGIINTTIDRQPSNQTGCVGGTAMFNVSAAGGQSYVWKKNGIAIPNSNNDTLILTNLTSTDFTSYTCEITGCNSAIINSNAATLTAAPASITTNTTVSNSLVCLGSSVYFFVGAQNAASYQWKKNNVNIPNTNNDTLMINAVQSNDAGNYTCEITGCSNNVLVSGAATFSITTNFATNNLVSYWKFDNNLTPTVGTNTFTPTNTSYAFTTDRASVANKAVMLTATNNALALTSPVTTDNISVSLWYKRVANSAGEAIIGSNSTNYGDMLFINASGTLGYQVGGSGFQSLGVTIANGWHHFVVTKAGTTTKIYVDGNNITIPTTIVAPPVMGSGASNTQINRFGNTAPIYNTNGAKGTFDEIRIYSSVLTATQVSDLFQLAEINSISGFGAVCLGSTASASVNVTAGPNVTYQWLKNGIPIQGANTATYTVNNVQVTDTGSYSCLVGLSTACAGVYSTNIGLSIVPNNLAITTQPTNQNVCPLQENNFITFQVTATGTNLTYQWKKNGINIPNAINAIYQVNIANVANNDSFTVMVSNNCSSILSNVALVKFIDALQITSQPTNLNVCANTNALFVIKTDGQNITYVWQKNGVSIPNSNNDSLLLTNVTAADVANYRVMMSYVCGSVISSTVTLSISSPTQIASQPVAQSVCASQGFNFSVTALGNNLHYQWKLNGNNITGANSSTFSKTLVSANDSGNYTVTVTGTCGSETSNSVKLSIVNSISILTQPSAVNLCQGSASYLSLVASGNNNTYSWFKNGTALTNSNNDTLYFNNLSSNDAGNYKCEVTSSCGSVSSAIAAVSVKSKSAFNFNKTICNGETFTFKGNALSQSGTYYDTTSNSVGCDSIITLNLTVNAPLTVSISNNQNVLTATTGFSSYQWYLNNAIITGATNATHTATANGDYTVKVKDATNCEATSNVLVIQNVGLETLNPLMFTIYPNPATKTLSIESNTDIIDIQIFTISGALVKNAVLTNNTITVEDLTSGIYFINITDNKGYTLTRKFVKQ